MKRKNQNARIPYKKKLKQSVKYSQDKEATQSNIFTIRNVEESLLHLMDNDKLLVFK